MLRCPPWIVLQASRLDCIRAALALLTDEELACLNRCSSRSVAAMGLDHTALLSLNLEGVTRRSNRYGSHVSIGSRVSSPGAGSGADDEDGARAEAQRRTSACEAAAEAASRQHATDQAG